MLSRAQGAKPKMVQGIVRNASQASDSILCNSVTLATGKTALLKEQTALVMSANLDIAKMEKSARPALSLGAKLVTQTRLLVKLVLLEKYLTTTSASLVAHQHLMRLLWNLV